MLWINRFAAVYNEAEASTLLLFTAAVNINASKLSLLSLLLSYFLAELSCVSCNVDSQVVTSYALLICSICSHVPKIKLIIYAVVYTNCTSSNRKTHNCCTSFKFKPRCCVLDHLRRLKSCQYNMHRRSRFFKAILLLAKCINITQLYLYNYYWCLVI